MRVPLSLAAMMLAAPALAAEPAPASGTATGEPVSCIAVRQITKSERPDDRTIIFRLNAGRYYRNDLPQSCPRLSSPFTAMSYRTAGSLCSIDVVHLFATTGGQGEFASCQLGTFTPWKPDRR